MDKLEMSQVEKLRLQLYKMVAQESELKMQILIRDMKISRGLRVDDVIIVQGDHIIINPGEKDKNKDGTKT